MTERAWENASETSPDTSIKGTGENFRTQNMLNRIAIYDLKVNLNRSTNIPICRWHDLL